MSDVYSYCHLCRSHLLAPFIIQLYAKHRELRESIEKQRVELEEKKRKLEGGDKKKMKVDRDGSVSLFYVSASMDPFPSVPLQVVMSVPIISPLE